MTFLLYILSISYALFICWCIFGWLRLPVVHPSIPKENNPFVSVIIPARNEAENIIRCLEDFLNQDYPLNSFEVIVINDHSSDTTQSLVRKFIGNHPSLNMKAIDLASGAEKKLYKKYAITKGIEAAAGSLIITTDADCRRGKKWISTMAASSFLDKAELISAPVFLSGERSWIEKIQSLEFLGLVAIGAAAIRNKIPFLCNGANLAFPKKIFFEVNGYASEKNSASGDDTQLMMKIVSRRKAKIFFIKSHDAVVTTMPQRTLGDLIHQRKRWASKIPFHMSAFTVIVASIAFLLHIGFLIQLFMVLYSGGIKNLLIPLAIKMIPEFIFLIFVCRFSGKMNLLILFLPAQVLYPIYISFVGITSLFGSHQWKGRRQS